MDLHTLDAQAGTSVRIEMASDDFDAVVAVEAPSGLRFGTDRAASEAGQDGTGRSAVAFDATETGRYRVIATSLRPGETGAYRLRVTQAQDF